ncbi:collagen alpha-1(III) chain-like [Pyrgilauda ruficollis]|uniref:collagen alpha-1(III) chain-like n=1 Tax=Pyrgilauda ruficollis TaxID=221976 RepID=UPI001B874541|nr:collagen alpha-1(III) chain-like [Pyrgilauda ruficollis]
MDADGTGHRERRGHREGDADRDSGRAEMGTGSGPATSPRGAPGVPRGVPPARPGSGCGRTAPAEPPGHAAAPGKRDRGAASGPAVRGAPGRARGAGSGPLPAAAGVAVTPRCPLPAVPGGLWAAQGGRALGAASPCCPRGVSGSPGSPCAGWGPLPVGAGGSRGSQGGLVPAGLGTARSLPVLGESSGVPRLSRETPGWLPHNWDPRCPHDGRRVPSPAGLGAAPPAESGGRRGSGAGSGCVPIPPGQAPAGSGNDPSSSSSLFPNALAPGRPLPTPPPAGSPCPWRPPRWPKALAPEAHPAGVGFPPVPESSTSRGCSRC